MGRPHDVTHGGSAYSRRPHDVTHGGSRLLRRLADSTRVGAGYLRHLQAVNLGGAGLAVTYPGCDPRWSTLFEMPDKAATAKERDDRRVGGFVLGNNASRPALEALFCQMTHGASRSRLCFVGQRMEPRARGFVLPDNASRLALEALFRRTMHCASRQAYLGANRRGFSPCKAELQGRRVMRGLTKLRLKPSSLQPRRGDHI